MYSAQRILSTSKISDVTVFMPSFGYFARSIVLHLLEKRTALLGRLSKNPAYPVRFCFSYRFLEVLLNIKKSLHWKSSGEIFIFRR